MHQIRLVWRSWRNSSAVMSPVSTIWLSSFLRPHCLSSRLHSCSFYFHLKPASFLCVWKLIRPNNTESSSDIYQPLTCWNWSINMSHRHSIPAAKYVSKRMFSAVLPKSKPCSVSHDTIHLSYAQKKSFVLFLGGKNIGSHSRTLFCSYLKFLLCTLSS